MLLLTQCLQTTLQLAVRESSLCLTSLDCELFSSSSLPFCSVFVLQLAEQGPELRVSPQSQA